VLGRTHTAVGGAALGGRSTMSQVSAHLYAYQQKVRGRGRGL